MRAASRMVIVFIVAVGAGCTGVTVGGEGLVVESGVTVIETETATAAGYNVETARVMEPRASSVVFRRTRGVAVRGHIVEYEKQVTGSNDTVVVGIVTLPDRSAGRFGVTSIPEMQDSALLSHYTQLQPERGEVAAIDQYRVASFGREGTVSVYRLRPESPDSPVLVGHLYRETPPDSSDIVVAYAVYPVTVDYAERLRIEALFDAFDYTAPPVNATAPSYPATGDSQSGIDGG